jgi:hypothetical protein
LAGNSRGGCWMGLGLLVGGVGARAMGGKLGLGEAPVLMGGGGRGGKAFVAGGFGAGGVGRAGTGLGETPAANWGFPGAGAAAGAVAVCGEVAGRSSILIVPVVRPALATSNAATLSQGEDSGCRGSRLRLGSAITSAAQLSSAVAKSNSCRVLKGTTGPDSAALKEPKNKLWASKPRGSKRGGTGR